MPVVTVRQHEEGLADTRLCQKSRKDNIKWMDDEADLSNLVNHSLTISGSGVHAQQTTCVQRSRNQKRYYYGTSPRRHENQDTAQAASLLTLQINQMQSSMKLLSS